MLAQDKSQNGVTENTERSSVSKRLQKQLNKIANNETVNDYTNRRTYLKRFAQSWKFYAKANDIAKREKLRKALLDALKSMNTKKKSTMTSLTHDTVERIQHAAHMLKEFKRMYHLSQDVMNSWKDYNEARKGLVDIGKTKEGSNILKKYVILRDKVSDNIKRSKIEKPSIVNDEDMGDEKNIAKDEIARHEEAFKSGGVVVQRAMTPGTLQIIRTKPNHAHRQHNVDSAAIKRMELLSDAKEAARAAYTKAKAAIQALKEKLKGTSSAVEGKDEKDSNKETNDKGTNKKSLLAQGENQVKEEGLGHVNNEMAISSLLKKAEKEDLAKITKGFEQHAAASQENVNKEPSHVTLQANSAQQNGQKEIPVPENHTTATANQTVATSNISSIKTYPTTSLTSLMDSLGGGDEPQAAPTKSQAKGSEASPKPIASSVQKGTEFNPTGNQQNPLYVASGKSEAVAPQKEAVGANLTLNQTMTGNNATENGQNKTTATNGTSGLQPAESSSPAQVTKVLLMSSETLQHKEAHVNTFALPNSAANASITTVPDNNTISTSQRNNTATVAASKRFRLNELTIQAQVAKTIDRQLETLQRLQEAKKARRKFDLAKRELQTKIKKLYDMALSFEKPEGSRQEMSTKTFIDPSPTKDEHPGAALAGISDKPVTTVRTPSDDGEHHGFTLGAMDSKSSNKAHIVDINEQDKVNTVEKVFQVGLPGGSEVEASPSRKSEDGGNDRALKSLTDAIKDDLRKIEENQKRQEREKKQGADIKKVIGPLVSEFTKANDIIDELKTKPTAKIEAKPAIAVTAPAKKKDTQDTGKTTDDAAVKAQDAFKEVEDYLSKALKHVAKEAISEENSSGKESELKEASDIIDDEVQDTAKVKSQSPTAKAKARAKVKDEGAKAKGSKNENEKQSENKDKTKAMTSTDEAKGEAKSAGKDLNKDERLRKIVEDAMKEHAKDPSNPHPVDVSLFKPTPKLNKDETTAKANEDLKKKDQNSTEQKDAGNTSAQSTSPEATVSRSNNDAIGKAEHLEEQVAQLQDKLYSQGPSGGSVTQGGSAHDAYKSIEQVDQKPMFAQAADQQESPGEQPGDQPTYTEPEYHHSHRRHHKHYDDDDAEDDRYDDDDSDDAEDDEEEDPRDRSENDDYDDDDDDEDRKRKKSYLQQFSWQQPYHKLWRQPFRNYQRDIITNKNQQQKQQVSKPELMNNGMMNENEAREELEDTKKSRVPTAKRTDVVNEFASTQEGDGKMYTL